jgi:hypothetical protein
MEIVKEKKRYHLPMQHVVTLIHGTWAANAPWLAESSPLCKAIREALPGDVIFAPFHWSGRNSFKARFEAAVGLSQHLIEHNRQYPSANHFAVAHSHGGNILLRVLEDEDCPKLKAIVFLSTPFLIVQERVAWRKQLALMATALSGLVFCAFYYETHGLFKLTYFILLSIVTTASLLFGLKTVLDHASVAARLIFLSVSTLVEKEGCLILKCDRDEAVYGLTTLQFLSAVFLRVQRNLPRLYVSVSFYCALGLAAMKLLKHEVGDIVLLIGFMLIPSLLVIIASAAATVMALGLGIEFILASLVLDISVESTPLGVWTVRQIRPAENPVRLRHSMSYEDENAVRAISDWLKSHA